MNLGVGVCDLGWIETYDLTTNFFSHVRSTLV